MDKDGEEIRGVLELDKIHPDDLEKRCGEIGQTSNTKIALKYNANLHKR